MKFKPYQQAFCGCDLFGLTCESHLKKGYIIFPQRKKFLTGSCWSKTKQIVLGNLKIWESVTTEIENRITHSASLWIAEDVKHEINIQVLGPSEKSVEEVNVNLGWGMGVMLVENNVFLLSLVSIELWNNSSPEHESARNPNCVLLEDAQLLVTHT